MEISVELIVKAILYLIGITPVVITQVIIYNKLKWDVENLKTSVNGVGGKVNNLDSKVNQNHIEEVLRLTHALEEIAFIKGQVASMYVPVVKNGHA